MAFSSSAPITTTPAPVSERLAVELDLLQAMYPDLVSFKPHTREIKYFSPHQTARLHLRLPDDYPLPGAGLPDILSANDASKKDISNQLKQAVTSSLQVQDGDEALDAIIDAFNNIVDHNRVAGPTTATTTNNEREGESGDAAYADTNNNTNTTKTNNAASRTSQKKTVIIWLHHLLATSKRKLAISPSHRDISGITKPGYPGVMLFSGPAAAVDAHVHELKQQNWQAFQVRYEEAVEWEILFDDKGGGGGHGVKELETMAEVVKMIEPARRDDFLRAMGMKV